jgi:RNA polymerase sigma factor (sigma-70 family)
VTRARNRVALVALALVFHIAGRHVRRCKFLEKGDLVAVGALAARRAADHFDAGRGSFVGFAGVAIARAIIIAIQNEERAIRIPIGVDEDLRAVTRARDRLFACKGEATPEAIASETQLRGSRVQRAIEHATVVASLDAPERSHDDDAAPLIESIGNGEDIDIEGTLDHGRQLRAVRRMLDRLPVHHRRVVEARVGGATLEEVAATIGGPSGRPCVRENIRLFEAKALAELRLRARRERLAAGTVDLRPSIAPTRCDEDAARASLIL